MILLLPTITIANKQQIRGKAQIFTFDYLAIPQIHELLAAGTERVLTYMYFIYLIYL